MPRSADWEEWGIKGPRGALLAAGHTGVERLALEALLSQGDRIVEEVRGKVDQATWSAMDSWISTALIEVADVGILLGAALATTGHTAETYDAWLQQAVATAGLAGYTCPVKLELPE